MGPKNFAQVLPTGPKLRHFFKVTDGQTHRRTDVQTFGSVNITIFYKSKLVWDLLKSDFDFMYQYDSMHPLASRGPKRADFATSEYPLYHCKISTFFTW